MRKRPRQIRGQIAAVYTSPLKRTLQTAQIIARKKKAPLIIANDLNEWQIKAWEGVPKALLAKLSDWKRLLHTPTELKHGERFTAVARRMLRFFTRITRKHRGGCVVAVSHGDPIAALLLKLQGRLLNDLQKLHAEKKYPAMGSVIAVRVGNGMSIQRTTTYRGPRNRRLHESPRTR